MSPKGTSPMGGDFDNRVAIPLSTFSRRLFNVDHLSQIVIGLENSSQLDATAQEITSLLDNRHNIRNPEDRDFTVRQAEEVVSFAGQTSRLLTIFLGIVAAISLIVGGVVIMNIMLISVGERTQEIGMLRAIGMTRGQVVMMVLAEASLMGVIGGLIGIVFGILLSRIFLTGMAAMSGYRLTFILPTVGILIGLIVSIVVSQIAAIQPARKAARTNVLEAIRYE